MNEQQDGQDGQAPTPPTADTAAPLYFSRTYDETLRLLQDARDCIIRLSDDNSLSTRARLTFSRETMRLTTRLTSVMAWLLAQRAVHAGEMSADEARGEAHELTARDLCLADGGAEDDALLPNELRSLLERSLALYARVDRLDMQVRAAN